MNWKEQLLSLKSFGHISIPGSIWILCFFILFSFTFWMFYASYLVACVCIYFTYIITFLDLIGNNINVIFGTLKKNFINNRVCHQINRYKYFSCLLTLFLPFLTPFYHEIRPSSHIFLFMWFESQIDALLYSKVSNQFLPSVTVLLWPHYQS